jgi:hypothetical protein
VSQDALFLPLFGADNVTKNGNGKPDFTGRTSASALKILEVAMKA